MGGHFQDGMEGFSRDDIKGRLRGEDKRKKFEKRRWGGLEEGRIRGGWRFEDEKTESGRRARVRKGS